MKVKSKYWLVLYHVQWFMDMKWMIKKKKKAVTLELKYVF
jgi:hypothetical protein